MSVHLPEATPGGKKGPPRSVLDFVLRSRADQLPLDREFCLRKVPVTRPVSIARVLRKDTDGYMKYGPKTHAG